MNLTFDPCVMPCESRERVHVDATCWFYEVVVLSDDVIKAFVHEPLHEGSTLAVVGNALRLLVHRP